MLEDTDLETKTTVIAPEELKKQAEICGEIRAHWAAAGRTPRAFVDTYGCQQNEADSEKIRGMLAACGYEMAETEEGADVIVLNTCAIREHAEQRVYGNVGALVHTKRRHPGQKIFLCGCMMGQDHVVQKIRESYRHVDGVFNPHQLWRFPELLKYVLSTNKRIFAAEDSAGSIAEGIPLLRQGGVKAWVSIMYGCNNFCSYCIVPYVRGRERSRRPEDILAEVRSLLDQGIRDITLLGQNVNSYGKDLGLGVDFADLLAEIARLPGDFWLRFMTSHPKDATQKLFDTMAASPKIAKQFHLPVQSGNDRVLKEMNRRYTREQYLSLVEYGRSVMPDLVLTSDIIVGFPGALRRPLYLYLFAPQGHPGGVHAGPGHPAGKERLVRPAGDGPEPDLRGDPPELRGQNRPGPGGRRRGRVSHRPHRGRPSGPLPRPRRLDRPVYGRGNHRPQHLEPDRAACSAVTARL